MDDFPSVISSNLSAGNFPTRCSDDETCQGIQAEQLARDVFSDACLRAVRACCLSMDGVFLQDALQ